MTSFLGPALLGVLSDVYSQRIGVGSLLVFFVLGGLILWRVDEREGIAAAGPGVGMTPAIRRRAAPPWRRSSSTDRQRW